MEPETGSLFMANLRNSVSWGSLLQGQSARKFDPEAMKSFSFVEHIPDDLLEFADRFALDINQEQINETAEVIRRELNDDQIMAAHPLQSFVLGTVQQVADPVNMLPGGAIYKNFKRGSRVMRAATGSALTAIGSTTLQEAALQSTQLTRETQESVLNVLGSGIVGGALGGFGAGLGARAKLNGIKKQRYVRDVVNELNDVVELALKENGTLTDAELDRMPKLAQKTMKITPMGRLLNSDFSTARIFGNMFYEHNFNLVKHWDGKTDAPSVETSIKTRNRKMAAVSLEVQDIFFKMNGTPRGMFRGTRDKLFGDQKMNWGEFNNELSYALTTGKEHAVPEVNQAANLYREKVIKPIFDDLVKLGKLAPDTKPSNAPEYFPIIYNKQLIVEQGGRSAWGPGTFPQALYDGYKATQTKIKQFKETPLHQEIVSKTNSLTEKRKQYKTERNSLPSKASLTKKIKELRAAKKTKAREAQIKKLNASITRRDFLNQALKDLDVELGNVRQKLKDSVSDDMLNSKGELRKLVSDKVLEEEARQTVDTILGHKDGALINPFLARIQSMSARPLKERRILIDQESLREWHITDASRVMNSYVRALNPVIELNRAAQKVGFEDMADLKAGFGKMLKEQYLKDAEGLTGKKASKLEEQYKNNIKDMDATVDIMLGIYGNGPNTLNNKAAEFGRNFLKWNAIRLLGFMTITSLADLGIQVFRNGPFNFVYHGLVPSLRGMKNLSKRDLQSLGYASETLLGTRLKAFIDHDGLSTEVGPFSKAFDAIADKFGNATLMNQWNDWQQVMAGTTSIHRTLDTIHAIKEGRAVSAKDRTRLAQLGIEEKYFDTIYRETKGFIDGPTETRYAGWDEWELKTDTDAEALRQFQAATAKDIDSIVIVPGKGDRPLFSYKTIDGFPVGASILQFKSFLLASTNKILYSGLQRRDADVMAGVVSMLGLGALSYVTTMYARGQEPDLSFGVLAQESIDRSGMLGIFMEVYNVGQKTGILPGANVTRYNSRTIEAALTGPAGGLASEIAAILSKIKRSATDEDTQFSTKDAQKLMRLVPYQNLFYMYQINKAVTDKIALGLGAEDARD